MLLFAVAIAGSGIRVARSGHAFLQTHDLLPALEVLAGLGGMAFLGLQIILFVVRRLPERGLPGPGPFLVAMAGAIAPLFVTATPRADPTPALLLASALLTTLGSAASVVVLAHLGRSFSVSPQARGLVTRGPYALVRHPLYLAELVSMLGLMLQYAQPWAGAAIAAAFVLQLVRMGFEETVLRAAYPAYEAYARRTARLIPGVW